MINNKFFTLILALVAFTLTGCYEPPTIQVNVPPPQVILADGDDDDSAAVGDDDDSADQVEEYETGEFRFGYSTAWSSTGHVNAVAPGTNNLGAYVTSFTGKGTATLETIDLDLEIVADPDEWSAYNAGCVVSGETVYCAADFIQSCRLQNFVSGEVYAQTEPTLEGDLAFPVNFTYTEQDPTRFFNVYCEFNGSLPDVEVAIAVSQDLSEGPKHVELDTQVPVTYTGFNGSDTNPSVAVHLYPEPCAAELILSDLGSGQVYCQGSLTTGSQFEDGMLVQHDQLNVLYYTHSGSRYYMPHGAVMESWYGTECSICNDVVQAGAELTNLALMGTVTAKPGSVIVTLPNDSQLWVVDSCRTLRSVTPLMAQSIYGVNWNDLVRIIPEVYFVDYTIGFAVLNVADYNPPTSVSIMDEMICTP